MADSNTGTRLSRRQALAMTGATAGGVLVTQLGGVPALAASRLRGKQGHLPAAAIQKVLEAEGTTTNGVLGVNPGRDDIGTVQGPVGVPFKAPFQLEHDLFFQPLGNKLAFFNGDVALKPEEINPVIDAIMSNGLEFQALHQHFYNLSPMVWFIHFRGVGEPLKLARAVRKVLAATATPLPQKSPSNPTTPLDVARLKKTLHGDSEVAGDGVVTIDVSRSDTIAIADIAVAPEANISTNIQFKPLDGTDQNVAVAPDLAMASGEIKPAIRLLRKYGFEIGCLYNQETDEQPQLYFAHALKVGNPYTIAAEIRQALDQTKAA